ncbi:hypothetical protein HGA92_00610 [Candidatus Gracilibacteria bacterium]|nr:hypothetical protein [Candidatus Gracilibacteria bacterium]NUJ98889.1 hypothetical protein [Candidatus Gracilibacteria bacterium]
MKSLKNIFVAGLATAGMLTGSGCGGPKPKETDTLVVEIKTKAGEITSITTEGPHGAHEVGDPLHLIQVTNFEDWDGNGVFQPNDGNPSEKIIEVGPYKPGIGEIGEPTETTIDDTGDYVEKGFVSNSVTGRVVKVLPPEEEEKEKK